MKLIKRARKKNNPPETNAAESTSSRVTDESLERHRKEIFSRGRRFVYPVHITKRHIVRNSLILIGIIIIGFLAVTGVAIYRYKSDSLLIYRISKVLPFPAAKVNNSFVSYEEYLFLLRSNQTYLANREQSQDNQPLLEELREQAYIQAKKNAILKQLGDRYNVTVTKEDIDGQIALLESFSGGQKRLDEIVSDFYGMSMGELRYLLYLQLLEQKLAPLISLEAKAQVESIQERLAAGEDFATLAGELSDDDQTASNGGSLGVVSTSTQDLPKEVVTTGLKLGAGATELVNGPSGFHIVKKIADKEDGSAELAHILIFYEDTDSLIEKELEGANVHDYIKP